MDSKTIKLQELGRRLVDREIHYCVSGLVYNVCQSEEAQRALDLDYETCYALSAQDDYEEPARNRIDDMDADELKSALADLDVEAGELEDSEDETALRARLIEEIEPQADGWREFCERERLDPDQHEVFEHWLISDWLARKLGERGEVICDDFCGLTIWGRTTTGQAIALDHVIQSIAAEVWPEELKDVA